MKCKFLFIIGSCILLFFSQVVCAYPKYTCVDESYPDSSHLIVTIEDSNCGHAILTQINESNSFEYKLNCGETRTGFAKLKTKICSYKNYKKPLIDITFRAYYWSYTPIEVSVVFIEYDHDNYMKRYSIYTCKEVL